MQLRNAVVRHHGSAITGVASDFTLFHSYRNRLWLLFKNMPPALLLVAVPLNILCSAIILLKLARLKMPIKASVRGLLSGMAPAKAFASRRRVQMNRRISTAGVARILDWNLARLRTRPVVIVAPPDGNAGAMRL